MNSFLLYLILKLDVLGFLIGGVGVLGCGVILCLIGDYDLPRKPTVLIFIVFILLIIVGFLIPTRNDALILLANSHPEEVKQLINSGKEFSIDWVSDVIKGIRETNA